VRRIVMIALSVLLALVVAMPMVSGQPALTAKPSQTVGELGADWWKWALQKPEHVNPLVGSYSGGPKCQGQRGGVFFLAGTITGESVTRECTVSSNTWIFFPIVNNFQAEPKGVGSEEAFRQFVNNCMDQALVGSTMFATLDGEPLTIQERADTPFFNLTLPGTNIFGDPTLAGRYQAVADGVWVLLPPLTEGTHTITFGGTFPNNPPGQYPEGCGGPFSQNNTYILTVK
jgi:hypothetical protein